MDTMPHRIEDTLSDFTQDRRIVALALLALPIGMLSALVAKFLIWLIAVITNFVFFHHYSTELTSLSGNTLGPWVILMPALGGVAIGLMARYGSPEIRGHGIPEALEAILFRHSLMRRKVAVLKPLSSAISIGTGGPFGAEGPIIMTGGAFGSLFSQCFKLSAAERKTLLVAGEAAGMAAIFATPIAAVLLAVELLLFEWRPRSFIPVSIAVATAATLRVPLFGHGPIFPVPLHGDPSMSVMPFALLVGVLAGLASAMLTWVVYKVEDIFDHIPVHWMFWPAIGGLAVGFIGWLDPRVLGVGYDVIQDLLLGHMTVMEGLRLFVDKGLAWTIALGSGTSGGVLAPLLMLGGALGTLEAFLIPVGDVALWSTISMAAVMGGTMRSPLTAIVFTLELTHDMNIMLPLLLGCSAAHLVTVLMMRRSILTEKIARRGLHITREYAVDPLSLLRVSEVMDPNVVAIPHDMTVDEFAARITRHDVAITRHQGVPVVDGQSRLVGILTHGDVLRSLKQQSGSGRTVLDVGTCEVVTAYPDEPLNTVLYRMIQHNIGRVPVVRRDNPTELVGYLGRSAIITAPARLLQEEVPSEKGLWCSWPFPKTPTSQ